MKKVLFKSTAAILTTALAVSAVPADFASLAAADYCTATVNVHLSNSDEPVVDNELTLQIKHTKEDSQRYLGEGDIIAEWSAGDPNPYEYVWKDLYPQGRFYVDFISNADSKYYYTLDKIGSASFFEFDFDRHQDVNISLNRYERPGGKDGFFVYLGRYGSQSLPLFMYFYPSKKNPSTYERREVIWHGNVSYDTLYGDIFAADAPFTTEPVEDGAYYYELKGVDSLTKKGCCEDIMERRNFEIKSADKKDAMVEGKNYVSDPYYLELETYGADTPVSYDIDLTDAYCDIDEEWFIPENPVSFYEFCGTLIVPADNFSVRMTNLMGDVNGDHSFTVADVVMLEKWLLGKGEALYDWKAADFCRDNSIDAYDLCLMKDALKIEMQKPKCNLTIHASYGGYGIDGQELESGEYTNTYRVTVGDRLYEGFSGKITKNLREDAAFLNKIITIDDITENGVSFTTRSYNDEVCKFDVKYGESKDVPSSFMICDGINYQYEASFSDFAPNSIGETYEEPAEEEGQEDKKVELPVSRV